MNNQEIANAISIAMQLTGYIKTGYIADNLHPDKLMDCLIELHEQYPLHEGSGGTVKELKEIKQSKKQKA